MLHKSALPDHVQQRLAWCQTMQATQPVWHDRQHGAWHVFRYDDVARVLTDYASFSSTQGADSSPIAASIIAQDPPRHRHLRGLIAQAFTPRAVAQLAPRITAIAQELIDAVRSRGHMDVIADLAYPLPAIVIAELLGVPSADRDAFKQWSDAIVTDQVISATDPRADQGQLVSPLEEMAAYCARLLAERRRQPQDDLISRLLVAEVDGEHLSEDELIGFCVLLLIAGHETTTNLLGNAILCLAAHPAALERLRREPGLMPTAIEEVLRYLPPVWDMFRTTTRDVEMGGQRIPAGVTVLAWMAAANRDPAHFPSPDTFDIARAPNRHLSFGHGAHYCIGAPLARLEAAITLPLLLEQLPDLRRVPDVPLEIMESGIVFGVKSLPVTFAAS